MASDDAVVSFRKGLRTRYALVLLSSSRTTIVLPIGEIETVAFDRSNRSKYNSVCYIKTTGEKHGSLPQITFKSSSITEALGVTGSSKPVMNGFDQYPLVSPFSPALLVLACRPTKAWQASHVMPYLADLSETTPSGDGYSGSDRLFLDAVRLGLGDELAPFVSIDPERQNWLSVLAAAASGKFDQALENCSKLTPGAHAERNTVVAAAIKAGDWSDVQSKVLGALDETLPGGALVAHVVDNSELGRNHAQAEAETLTEWISDKTESAWAKRCVKGLSLRPLPPISGSAFASSDSYRVAAVLSDRSKAGQRILPDIAADSVRELCLEVVDELIERQAISKTDLRALQSVRPRDATYLALRLSPGALSDADLVGSIARQELIRRQVIECLRGASDAADGPGSVLAKLRDGQPATEGEIECLPEGWKETARKLSEFLRTGDVDLAVELADDPTLVPVIAKRLADEIESLPRKGPLADIRASQCLQDSLQAVLQARWTDALDLAKEVMRYTEREDLRDEALNLMACAHWQLGNDDEALAALRSALEGEYNSALQINVGVVASNLEPVVAAGHLGKLATEAPSSQLRVKAAIRGVQLWSADLEIDDESPLPGQLLDALRTLAADGQQDLTMSDNEYWSVLEALSVHDSEWIGTSLKHSSPVNGRDVMMPVNGRDVMMGVAVARAENPVEYVKAVGRLSASTSSWCQEQRESIVGLVLALQLNDPMSIFAAVMGMEFLKTDIAISADEAIRVRCLTLIGVSGSMDEDHEPSDEVQGYLQSAHDLMGSCTPEQQADLKPLIGYAGRALLVSVATSRGRLVDQVAEASSKLATTLSQVPRRRRNMTEVRDWVRPMRKICTDSIRDLKRLSVHADDDDLLAFVNAVIAQAVAINEFFDTATR